MYNIPQSAEDHLLSLFGRLLKLAFSENPLENSGISLPQLSLLDWIAANPGCNLHEIADGLSLTPPTVSVAVRRMEEVGYLYREPDPDDGRAVQFTLTPAGIELYKHALAYRQSKMRLLLRGLSLTEVDTLLSLLGKAISAAGEEACP
jgi:DNA-binding MarR family transcriptional regulator